MSTRPDSKFSPTPPDKGNVPKKVGRIDRGVPLNHCLENSRNGLNSTEKSQDSKVPSFGNKKGRDR